ncbi:TaqI-like C-terminal specificity domain-containing protein [Rufibacter sp. LB8]|uniref:TaqI-like C-terminal specificity domain-containing protein n=1 Tax=Rufibacter sp. LB8 TaxID=2777781 RepID=UPI00178C5AA5
MWSDYVSQNKALATNFSGESGWVILSEIETRIKQKVEAIGTPLKEWDIQINYGIKTGFNEAFIIDGQKRAELLEKCPKADEIIRPILRGRDIKKYKAEFADQWMIFIPWHFPLQNDISVKGSSNEAEKAFRDSYPDIYNHLIQFKEPLSKRNPAETGKRYEWYALQRFGSNYWPDFNKEKIVWIELTNSPKFAIDTNGYYLNNTIFFMTGNHLKYLLSYLNSRLCEWHFDKIAATSGAGTRRWIKIYIDQICAPKPDLKNESDINDLIDNAIKNQSNENLEKIDAYFYKVFNLDVLEIETIISAEL